MKLSECLAKKEALTALWPEKGENIFTWVGKKTKPDLNLVQTFVINI